jgi:hypothetical protein
MENWLLHDCFEKRIKKRKLLRFAPGNGCPFFFISNSDLGPPVYGFKLCRFDIAAGLFGGTASTLLLEREEPTAAESLSQCPKATPYKGKLPNAPKTT